jgi:hypothetical protein
MVLRSRWPVHELAAAVGAEIVERIGAFGAERAFEAADEGPRRLCREVNTAAFAIGAHFQHFCRLAREMVFQI